jgi:hypothetical protein
MIPKFQMNRSTHSNIEVSAVTLRSREAIRRLVKIGVEGEGQMSKAPVAFGLSMSKVVATIVSIGSNY